MAGWLAWLYSLTLLCTYYYWSTTRLHIQYIAAAGKLWGPAAAAAAALCVVVLVVALRRPTTRAQCARVRAVNR